MQNKFKLHPCCIPVSGINQNNEQILVKRKWWANKTVEVGYRNKKNETKC